MDAWELSLGDYFIYMYSLREYNRQMVEEMDKNRKVKRM